MTSLESGPPSPRLSDADRESALSVLRESAAHGRVSQETFVRRMEIVMSARRPDELIAVLQDLPQRAQRPGLIIRTVTRASSLPSRIRRAWQVERLPQLLLPAAGPFPLSIGRAPGSVLRLNDFTVSRYHAQLRATGTGWTLRDLGSANGTWVNGRRVTDPVPVGPGDQVDFGRVAYRLARHTAPGQLGAPGQLA